MKWRTLSIMAAVLVVSLLWLPAPAADDSKVGRATRRVETGARKIGEGVEETAKGVGRAAVEGAKWTGEKLKKAGKAAEPQAKTAWQKVRDGAIDFGRGVKHFFGQVFR